MGCLQKVLVENSDSFQPVTHFPAGNLNFFPDTLIACPKEMGSIRRVLQNLTAVLP